MCTRIEEFTTSARVSKNKTETKKKNHTFFSKLEKSKFVCFTTVRAGKKSDTIISYPSVDSRGITARKKDMRDQIPID
jgi:hypothetical protein